MSTIARSLLAIVLTTTVYGASSPAPALASTLSATPGKATTSVAHAPKVTFAKADAKAKAGAKAKAAKAKPRPTRATATKAPTRPTPAPVVGVAAAKKAGPKPTTPPAPVPTASPTTVPAPAPTAARVVQPESFGAKGDGVADDTQALQRSLDSLAPGMVLQLSAGRTYRHTDVLVIRVAGSHVTGPGVLLATSEERSAVWIAADDVLVDGGLVLRMGATTRRWDAWEQMKVRLLGHRGIVLRNVVVDGAAAAGVYVGGASQFLLEDVTVRNTRADGIHMTGGAHDGTVLRPRVSGTGDDGVAVVSYRGDGAVSHHITVQSPTVLGTTWGRGLTVVGGEDITYRDVLVRGSNGAGVYIANEGAPYYTYGTRRVTVSGGRIESANTNAGVDHGAVLLYSAQAGAAVADTVVDGLAVAGTRATASWHVGVVVDAGAVTNAALSRLAVTGSGPRPFSSNAPTTAAVLTGWTVEGAPYSATAARR